MARYTVTLTTSANAVVDVEVPDDVTDPEEIAELAVAALEDEGAPDLCNACATPVQLGDDWRPARHQGAPLLTRHDA
ncbi:hypothetical protein [Kitasatospora camelliae]|uniref:Uncharacterized protein n=1 Tax=Kitasatospora camelliae TaxID=3156397 RepID=A0AAU8K6T7_9ACTN